MLNFCPCLIDINSPALVVIVLSLSILFFFYLTRSLVRFLLSFHLLVIFFYLSLCFIVITSPILPVKLLYLSWFLSFSLLKFFMSVSSLLFPLFCIDFCAFGKNIGNTKNYDSGSTPKMLEIMNGHITLLMTYQYEGTPFNI